MMTLDCVSPRCRRPAPSNWLLRNHRVADRFKYCLAGLPRKAVSLTARALFDIGAQCETLLVREGIHGPADSHTYQQEEKQGPQDVF